MEAAKQIPKDEPFDSTLALLKEGYNFIPNRLKKFQTNIFQTRILGKRVIVISGKDAAEIFYDNERMTRYHVVPKRIQKSLFGIGGVQGLDGKAHQHRKQLFMSLMTKERIHELLLLADKQLELAVKRWEKMDTVYFYPETEKLSFQLACQWTGVPLWAKELNKRAHDMGAMVDALGAVGKRYIQGTKARKRTELWMESLVEQVRSGLLLPDENTALYQFAWHKGLNGDLLHSRIAAVEVINMLRPLVAIARFLTFGMVALHDYPEAKQKFEQNKGKYREMFIQEVRRFYPFTPFLGAKSRVHFHWNGFLFKKGTLVILDIYGMNRSKELWERPDEFYPERFENWEGNLFLFIPQGGGSYEKGHRCAGEKLTVELMRKCLGFITDEISYSLPPQDLSYPMNRIPTMPESSVILTNVSRKTR